MSVTTVPSTTFSEVLLASDFSEESDRALTYAKSIVRGSGGELLLVHVAQLAPVLALPEGVWVDDSVRIRAEEQETEEAAAALRAKGLKVRAFCPFGCVGLRIGQTAEIHHADLVVIGTHGRRGLNRLIFGSYAEEAASFVETPLMVIGPKAPLAHATAWRPSRILCSTSFSAGDAMIVAFAFALAQKYQAPLEIVSESSDGADRRWIDLRKSAWRLTASDGPNELPLPTIHLPKPMAKSLTEAVITRDADLLVIGGDSRERRALHEGTLQEFLVDVPCPIITFPT